MRRMIIYQPSFTKAVARLGGYRRIDIALESVMNGLEMDPAGFEIIRDGTNSARWAKTKAIPGIPALVLTFVIGPDSNVYLYDIWYADET